MDNLLRVDGAGTFAARVTRADRDTLRIMSAPTESDPAAAAIAGLQAARASLGTPLVLQLVDAVPEPGSRPVLAGALARDAGLPSVIVAVIGESTVSAEVDGVPVLTVPIGTAFRDLAKAAALDSPRLTSWLDARDRAIAQNSRGDALGRARRAVLQRSQLETGAVPDHVRAADGEGARRWVRSPGAADLELAAATAIDSLRPAVVHVYGTTVAAALRAVAFARVRGDDLRVVVDASLPLPSPDQLAAADGVVVPLPFVADQFDAARVVPFTGPRSSSRSSALRERLAFRPEERLVAVRWAPAQAAAVQALVLGLADLPDVHIVIVGSRTGPGLTAVLAEAQARGLRGRVHTSPDTGVGALRGVDATVVLAAGTAVPVELLESVQVGAPVVATATPSVESMLAGQGFGVSHDGTTPSLVSAVGAVLADPRYRGAAQATALAGPAWSAQRSALRDLYVALLPTGTRSVELPPVDDAVAVDAPLTTPVASAVAARSGVRLGIGPANYAGQATAWARALRESRGIDATSFGDLDPFGYTFDQPQRPIIEGDNTAGAARTAWLLDTYSHLVLDGFQPATGGFVPGGTAGEVEFFGLHDRVVGVLCHGTEIRDPDRHIARLPQSYYARAPRDWLARVRGSVHANTAALGRLQVPTFVSTPDLLLDLPGATWVPVVVDVDHWAGSRPALDSHVPRVLHAPSKSTPPVKGTDIIEPVLRRLHAEGVLEYVAAEGLKHEEMLALVSSVDVVVDQIVSGFYGVAAVEAMANGRLVVGLVASDVRALMDEPPPIVDVLDADVETTIRAVLADRDAYALLAAAGPGFARRWHDGRGSAEILARFVEG